MDEVTIGDVDHRNSETWGSRLNWKTLDAEYKELCIELLPVASCFVLGFFFVEKPNRTPPASCFLPASEVHKHTGISLLRTNAL